MITNTDLTIYHREYDPKMRVDVWTRFYVSEAWWFTAEKATLTTDGLMQADITTIRIPDISKVVVKDDYIVKGACSVEMQTVKDLKETDYVKVTSANYNRFGNNPHIKVAGVKWEKERGKSGLKLQGAQSIRNHQTVERFLQNWNGIRHLLPTWERDLKARRDLLIQNVSGV